MKYAFGRKFIEVYACQKIIKIYLDLTKLLQKSKWCRFLTHTLCLKNTPTFLAITRESIDRFLLANANSCSRSLYVVVRPSVCSLSVCRLSVTFVHLTQPIEIFGNVSAPWNTLVT